MPIKMHPDLGTLVPVDHVQPHPDNPWHGDLAAITESIKRNGLYRPIYVQRSTNYIVAGNHTWRALFDLGERLVPVIYLDLDEEQAHRILLADNKIAELGSYDNDALIAALQSIEDLGGTGWTSDDLESLLNVPKVPDEELDADPVMGDLQFRVIVDCNDEDDQAFLLRKLEAEGRTCRPLIS